MAAPTKPLIIKMLGENYRESDDQLIELYVDTHRYYRRLKKEVASSPLMQKHTNKAGAENIVKNPLAIEITKTVQTLNNLLKSLGLTPAQRKQIDGDYLPPNIKNDGDDFDDF